MFAHNPKVQDAIRLRSCHANLALPTLPGFRLMLKSTVQSTSFHCLLLFFSFNVELLLPFAQYKKYFPPTDVYHTNFIHRALSTPSQQTRRAVRKHNKRCTVYSLLGLGIRAAMLHFPFGVRNSGRYRGSSKSSFLLA